MEPAEFFHEEDGQGRALRVCGQGDGKAVLQVFELDGGGMRYLGSWVADPAIALDLHRAICEASGTVPPVMLGRPDLASARDVNGWVAFRGLELRKADDGGVTFSVGGNTETLPAHQARQATAVAVALADEADAEPLGTLRRAFRAMRSDAERCGDKPGSFVAEVADWLAIEIAALERKLPDDSGSVHVALRIARAYLGEAPDA